MKICIYGAGAIGGYLGARLADGSSDVRLVARGPHLEAMRSSGLTLQEGGETRVVDVDCTNDPAEMGIQDFVILTLKAHSIAPVVDQIAPLLGPDTAIVTAQNGIPWWYFYGLPGPWENHHLEAADPRGYIWKTLGPERAIGSIVYPSCEIVAPGVVRHLSGNRFMLGEPTGVKSDRVMALGEVITAAGLKAPIRKKIRDDIWFKLLGNATFNPISVLTHATLEQMYRNKGVRDVIRQMMAEVRDVALMLGVEFSMDIEKRLHGTADVGAHKTSMLQDFEHRRPLELDTLVASVSEIGRMVDVPTPTIDTMLALVRLRIGVDL